MPTEVISTRWDWNKGSNTDLGFYETVAARGNSSTKCLLEATVGQSVRKSGWRLGLKNLHHFLIYNKMTASGRVKGEETIMGAGPEAGVGQQTGDPNERVLENKCEELPGAILRALRDPHLSWTQPMISRSHGLSVLSITTSNQTKYFPKMKDKPFSSHLSCRSLIVSLDLELTACRAPWLTGTHNPSHTCSGNSEEGQPQTPQASGYRHAYLSVPSDLVLEKNSAYSAHCSKRSFRNPAD